jgi:hypothetical protein
MVQHGGERLRRLSLARENYVAEFGEPGLHHRIGRRFNGCRIELADDILRRAPGREQPAATAIPRYNGTDMSGRDRMKTRRS